MNKGTLQVTQFCFLQLFSDDRLRCSIKLNQVMFCSLAIHIHRILRLHGNRKVAAYFTVVKVRQRVQSVNQMHFRGFKGIKAICVTSI